MKGLGPHVVKGAAPHIAAFFVGVWLMFAPAVLGYVGSAAATSDRLVGPVVAAIGFVAASQITRSLRWINLIAAAWLLAGPWLLGFPATATINSMIAGAFIAAVAPLGRPDPGRFGGGWTSLRRPERMKSNE